MSYSIPPERVVQVLTRSEHGAAMWRAASYEALCEVQQERIAELEAQRAPAAEPAGPGHDGEPRQDEDAATEPAQVRRG